MADVSINANRQPEDDKSVKHSTKVTSIIIINSVKDGIKAVETDFEMA